MPPDPDLIASIKQFREEQEHEEQRLLTRHTARLKAWKSAAISLAIVGHALLIAFLTLFYKGMLSPGYASATVLGLMICAVILSFLFPKKKNTPGAREENDAVFPEDKQLISVVAALACEAALSTAVFFGFKLVIRILVNYGMFP